MLLSLWSPKGGSGTSVIAAACAIVLASDRRTRLVDLDGDQAAVLGLASNGLVLPPEATEPGVSAPRGVRDWLAVGPGAPADALGRLAVDVGPGLVLVPPGTPERSATGEAGAALGVVLRDAGTAVADCGRADDAASRALVEVSDFSVVVIKPCYLALRRAAADELVRAASGIVVVEEPGRALGAREVADVLGVPVLASVPARAAIARVVDAGVLVARLPDSLARPVRTLLERLGVSVSRGHAA